MPEFKPADTLPANSNKPVREKIKDAQNAPGAKAAAAKAATVEAAAPIVVTVSGPQAVSTPYGTLLTGVEYDHFVKLRDLSERLDALTRVLPRLSSEDAVAKIDEFLPTLPPSEATVAEQLNGIRAAMLADKAFNLHGANAGFLGRLMGLRSRADDIRLAVGFAAGACPKGADKYTVQPVSAPRNATSSRGSR